MHLLLRFLVVAVIAFLAGSTVTPRVVAMFAPRVTILPPDGCDHMDPRTSVVPTFVLLLPMVDCVRAAMREPAGMEMGTQMDHGITDA